MSAGQTCGTPPISQFDPDRVTDNPLSTHLASSAATRLARASVLLPCTIRVACGQQPVPLRARSASSSMFRTRQRPLQLFLYDPHGRSQVTRGPHRPLTTRNEGRTRQEGGCCSHHDGHGVDAMSVSRPSPGATGTRFRDAPDHLRRRLPRLTQPLPSRPHHHTPLIHESVLH